MVSKVVIFVWLMSLFIPCFSQENSELSYAEQLEALESELDSLSIFNLLDSVLLLESTQKSELNWRYGITSSVTSAGRDYNINQTGYSTGLSYFHKSGTYLDLSGYWNTSVEPSYNPTILSAGYLGSFSPKWTYSFDYEHWFYNPKDSSENELTNSLGTSLSYDFKIGYVSLDYSYLFGKSTSNRIIGSLAGNINFGKWWIFKSVSSFPTFTMMAGNGNITTLRITTEQISDELRFTINTFDKLSNLTDEQINQLKFWILNNDRISRPRKERLITIIETYETLNPTPEELAELNDIAENGIEQQELIDGDAFGTLNYSFTLPVSFTTNRLSILLSYTYSIPVKLPGEFFDVDPIGYFGVSLLYRIPFN